jgi:hypothetical protein
MRSDLNKDVLLGAVLSTILGIAGCGSPSSTVVSTGPPPLTTVTVTPASATLLRGEKQQFAAQVTGPRDKTVTWSVDAASGSVDSNGLYTAPANIDGTTAVVTATSKATPTVSATAAVTLPRVTLTIAPDTIAVTPGASHTFNSTVTGLPSTQVVWTIQETGGGAITSTGVYTAPSTTAIYHVRATYSANANYSATATVLVTNTPSSFTPTGDVNDGREFHTGTLLSNGKVLVAGGTTFEAYCFAGIPSAELYNPATGSFALTATMTDRRYAQTATLLQNGRVLISGGFSFDATACLNDGTSPALTSAELYDPSSASFASTGSMAEARGVHTATLLANGKVLITGGGKTGGGDPPFAGTGSATAELYDPGTGLFTSTGNMKTGRMGQTATLLPNGKVLIAGGLTSSLSTNPVATAELYDPMSGTFAVTGSMTVGRAGHAATLLQNGKVLIAGGLTAGLKASNTAEIYDPATGSFVATGLMAVARQAHTTTLLPNGTVLVVGGGSSISEIYDQSTASFSPSALAESDRSGHSATLLSNGSVLVIGGSSSPKTAELYP